jgi:hypothetical protein
MAPTEIAARLLVLCRVGGRHEPSEGATTTVRDVGRSVTRSARSITAARVTEGRDSAAPYRTGTTDAI